MKCNNGMVFFSLMVLLLSSCKTIDYEKTMVEDLKNRNKMLEKDKKQLETAVQTLVQVEKTSYTVDVEPVVIPVVDTIVITEGQEPPKMTADQAVRKTMNEAIVTPENNIGGTQIFDYNEYKQFPITAQMLQQTAILLEKGEILTVDPFISDPEKWELDGDIWNGQQLIVLKPYQIGLKTNMLVATNKRIYNFLLFSTKDMYMPMVRFRYPLDRANIGSKIKRVKAEEEHNIEYIDPALISANYKINYSLFFPPYWIPELVYDDGQKTYIKFKEGVLQRELPVVFEKKNEILNYRVDADMIIIDKLVTKMTLKLAKDTITIIKKKGTAEKL